MTQHNRPLAPALVRRHTKYRELGHLQRPLEEGHPPFRTQVTIVGKNEIYHRENFMGHFWYTNFWDPDPPSSLSPLSTAQHSTALPFDPSPLLSTNNPADFSGVHGRADTARADSLVEAQFLFSRVHNATCWQQSTPPPQHRSGRHGGDEEGWCSPMADQTAKRKTIHETTRRLTERDAAVIWQTDISTRPYTDACAHTHVKWANRVTKRLSGGTLPRQATNNRDIA